MSSVAAFARAGYVAPHAGAWIEIEMLKRCREMRDVAPHAGAWIEITASLYSPRNDKVAPHAGAWIEMRDKAQKQLQALSPPTRGRGLKCPSYELRKRYEVAPHAGAWIEMLTKPQKPQQSNRRPPRGGVD